MLLAFAAVLVFVSTIVGRNLSAVQALWNGGLDFGDGLGRFSLSVSERLVAAGLVLLIFAAALGLQYQLSGVQDRYTSDKGRAERAQTQMEDLEDRMDEAVRGILARMRTAWSELGNQLELAKMKNDMRRYREELEEVREFSMASGHAVLSGEKWADIGSVSTLTTELHVYDPVTHEKTMDMVVHIFHDTAYWEFQDTLNFVGLDGETDVNLWRHLRSEEAMLTLSQFDIVAGLGLESKTRGEIGGFSAGRAQTLCNGLNGILGKEGSTQAFGLDIGKYRGAAGESKNNLNHRLRPVVLIGINAPENTKYREFLAELLVSVELPGLDLGNFEKLRRGHRPGWVLPPECVPDHEFMIE